MPLYDPTTAEQVPAQLIPKTAESEDSSTNPEEASQLQDLQQLEGTDDDSNEPAVISQQDLKFLLAEQRKLFEQNKQETQRMIEANLPKEEEPEIVITQEDLANDFVGSMKKLLNAQMEPMKKEFQREREERQQREAIDSVMTSLNVAPEYRQNLLVNAKPFIANDRNPDDVRRGILAYVGSLAITGQLPGAQPATSKAEKAERVESAPTPGFRTTVRKKVDDGFEKKLTPAMLQWAKENKMTPKAAWELLTGDGDFVVAP